MNKSFESNNQRYERLEKELLTAFQRSREAYEDGRFNETEYEAMCNAIQEQLDALDDKHLSPLDNFGRYLMRLIDLYDVEADLLKNRVVVLEAEVEKLKKEKQNDQARRDRPSTADSKLE